MLTFNQIYIYGSLNIGLVISCLQVNDCYLRLKLHFLYCTTVRISSFDLFNYFQFILHSDRNSTHLKVPLDNQNFILKNIIF